MSRQVKRISDLPEAGPIQGDELLEMVQGGENVRVRADQLGGTELPIEMTDVTGLPEALDERVLDDDPRLSDARVPTGVAGGVLSGQYPNPGFAVPMATAAQLDGKVDKVEGKGLSTNDLTDPLYDKLVGLEGTHWRGTFVSLAALEAGVTDPQAGDYADVDVVGEDVRRYIWDATDSAWVAQSGEVAPLTAAQVKLLYESNPDTNAFTDADEAKLDSVKEWATAETQDAAQTALGFSVSGKSVATGTPAQGRAGLGLGTAATADVTTTATDPTSGRVMKVGDFGIGSDAALPWWPLDTLGDSATTPVGSGYYRMENMPDAPFNGTVLHIKRAAGDIQQVAFHHTSNQIYFRGCYEDNWRPWNELYHTGNLTLQSLGISSGISSIMLSAGAIVEMGENANGSYWRWESGLQVCVASIVFEGSGSGTRDKLWVFPAQFNITPEVVTSPTSGPMVIDKHGSAQAGMDPTIERRLYVAVDSEAATSVSLGAVAIGLWK